MKLTRENVFPWENAIDGLLYEMEGNEDYLKGAKDFLVLLNKTKLLPSKYQIGDIVSVNFYRDDILITKCKIIKVHFTKGKILYDLEVPINEYGSTRLYNIDSVFVVE